MIGPELTQPATGRSHGEIPVDAGLSIKFPDRVIQELLHRDGLREFQDFWNLPRDYVDPVNIRRGGWSATSRFQLSLDGRTEEFFIKRQSNQRRYSLRYPFGTLTYRHELDAIQRNIFLGLPAVQWCGAGFRVDNGQEQGFIVTRAIRYKALSELRSRHTDWDKWSPVLERAGKMLFAMHRQHISHGALFPNHLFLDDRTRQVNLIDFERSRRHVSKVRIINHDLSQLLRRSAWLPMEPLNSLLTAHITHYPELIAGLLLQFRPRPDAGDSV